MLIKELIVGVELKENLDLEVYEIEVSNLTLDSKKCSEGSLFFTELIT